jgi:N-succinyldiaminopimelate aminotransferase
MAERTVTCSSLGKTFSLTGWKIGWTIAPPDLTRAIRMAHQYLIFAVATPFQHAGVVALRDGESYVRALRAGYERRRDTLADALASLGLTVFKPAGAYFVLADHTPLGFGDDVACCRALATEAKVAAIPPSAFYSEAERGRSLVRFVFCKRDETLAEAMRRLEAYASARGAAAG